MKVLMIIKFLHYSGAPKMFVWVAEKLASLGVDVTILTYRKTYREDVPHNIKWVRLDLESAGFFKTLCAVRRQVKVIKPDLSISFLLDANIFNILACLGRKTKSIVCERNDPFKPKYYKLKLFYPLFALADGAVYQLPKVAEFYKNIRKPTTVIPNPVMKDEFLPVLNLFEQRDNVIVSMGRLDVEQKRQDILIKAFAIFNKLHSEYSLHIYGDGGSDQDNEFLRQLCCNLGLEDKVIFKGVTDSPKTVMSSAKIYILSSDFEGIPNALIEAMSLGMPTISTNCRPGGAALLIRDGENGFLVPQGDFEAIAEKMNFFVENPAKANEMGNCAKNIVNEFAEDKIAHLWLNYLELVNNGL